MFKNLDQSEESSEEDLIKNFQRMLIHPKNNPQRNGAHEPQNGDINTEIFAFLIFKDQHQRDWLHDYLREINVIAQQQLFSRKSKYLIQKLKVSAQNELASFLLLNIKEAVDHRLGVYCLFKPTFTLKVDVLDSPFSYTQISEGIVEKDGQPVYLVGKKLSQSESDLLEYKSYNVSFMLNHKDTLMKHICAFLNRGIVIKSDKSQSKFIIGVGKDKTSGAPIVNGVRVQTRKAEILLQQLQESLLQIKASGVHILSCQCGITSNDQLYIVEGLRIFEITIDYQSEVVYFWKKGYYHYRSSAGFTNIPLQRIYELYREKMIVEEDFVASLKVRDELEEQLTNKKLKQNDNK